MNRAHVALAKNTNIAMGKYNTNLASHYVITRPLANMTEAPVCLARAQALIGQGERLIQLRQPQLTDSDFTQLATQMIRLTQAQPHVKLLLNSKPKLVKQLGASGVHLNSQRLMACQTRPLDLSYLVAASCHTEQELAHAARIQCDFVVLGPVKATTSHPQAKPLGWPVFNALATRSKLPIYALGGMQLEDLSFAKQHNAHGIAGITMWINA